MIIFSIQSSIGIQYTKTISNFLYKLKGVTDGLHTKIEIR